MRYLEDFRPGTSHVLGSHTLSLEEILDYSRVWDPHPIHTDPDSAEARALGGVIAAGTHLMAIPIKLLVDIGQEVALIAGLGWDQVRFLRPGRPGDRVTVRITCREVKRSRSKPDRGVVCNFVEMTNQEGQDVLSFLDFLLVRHRPESADRGGDDAI